ncbi:hypothetical protein C2S51_010585 [Perilla frutescens var. frutescens]|nr:hypothetical protein C2S51_010585 [Perilla frutescens var. frutescens]
MTKICSNNEEIEGEAVYLDEQVVVGSSQSVDMLVNEHNIPPVVPVKGSKIVINSESKDEDGDYICKEDSCDELMDDIIFNENIDKDVEWAGTKQGINDEDSSDTSDVSDDVNNESDFDSVDSDNGGRDCSERASLSSIQNPTFTLGQIFSTKFKFKEVVNNYSVKIGRPSKFIKNDARRIYARCKNRKKGVLGISMP